MSGFCGKERFLRLFLEYAISAVLFRTWLEINAITFKNQFTWRKFLWDVWLFSLLFSFMLGTFGGIFLTDNDIQLVQATCL
jgi:hypothetical protein